MENLIHPTYTMFGQVTPAAPRAGNRRNGIPGSMLPKTYVCPGLDAAAGWGLAAGVKNALGKAGYPC